MFNCGQRASFNKLPCSLLYSFGHWCVGEKHVTLRVNEKKSCGLRVHLKEGPSFNRQANHHSFIHTVVLFFEGSSVQHFCIHFQSLEKPTEGGTLIYNDAKGSTHMFNRIYIRTFCHYHNWSHPTLLFFSLTVKKMSIHDTYLF